MLNQFRTRYPQGCLTSELLAIEHGKYIVKVSVHVEGIILATGLSASDSLEQAEDTARIRALMAINLDSTVQESYQQSEAEKTTLDTDLPESSKKIDSSPLEPLSLPISTQPSVNGNKKPEIIKETLNETLLDNSTVLTPPSPTPELPVDLLEAETSSEVNVSESLEDEPLPSSISSTPKISDTPKTQQATIQSTEPETLPIIDSTPEEILSPEPQPIAEVAAPSLSSQESTSSPAETLDFSDIMARSNAQLKRLGWTTEKGRDYLLKTYGKKSRHLLNDEELLQFLNYLESLPTS